MGSKEIFEEAYSKIINLRKEIDKLCWDGASDIFFSIKQNYESSFCLYLIKEYCKKLGLEEEDIRYMTSKEKISTGNYSVGLYGSAGHFKIGNINDYFKEAEKVIIDFKKDLPRRIRVVNFKRFNVSLFKRENGRLLAFRGCYRGNIKRRGFESERFLKVLDYILENVIYKYPDKSVDFVKEVMDAGYSIWCKPFYSKKYKNGIAFIFQKNGTFKIFCKDADRINEEYEKWNKFFALRKMVLANEKRRY